MLLAAPAGAEEKSLTGQLLKWTPTPEEGENVKMGVSALDLEADGRTGRNIGKNPCHLLTQQVTMEGDHLLRRAQEFHTAGEERGTRRQRIDQWVGQ